jgi:hypothetical protein
MMDYCKHSAINCGFDALHQDLIVSRFMTFLVITDGLVCVCVLAYRLHASFYFNFMGFSLITYAANLRYHFLYTQWINTQSPCQSHLSGIGLCSH